MFGLFGNKVKKESAKRAEAWWKTQKILGMKKLEKKCSFCHEEIPRLKGYLFTAEHMMANDKFMNSEINHLEAKGIAPEEAQRIVWERLETSFEDWFVCDKCIDRLA